MVRPAILPMIQDLPALELVVKAEAHIDGEAGILMHKGYMIEDLAEHSDYMELCYMLVNDDLPNKAEKAEFVKIITEHSMIHEQLKTFYDGFWRGAHPMAIMCRCYGCLSAFYPDSIDILDQSSGKLRRIVSSLKCQP